MPEESQAELLAATPYEVNPADSPAGSIVSWPRGPIAAGTRLGYLPGGAGQVLPIDTLDAGFIVATRYCADTARLTIFVAPLTATQGR
jgi:hypothetical protein